MSDTPDNVVVDPSAVELMGGPPSNDGLPGMTLGDYVVEKAVAWGGMGIVYCAVHPLIGRKVAIKVLRPTFASDPEQMSRFLKEAQAISSIKHRGIIDIIGFGKIPQPDGRQYMVMEFLEGETLEATMLREGAMTPVRALTLVDEILDALSAAHKVGVVHRDLKPANIYITLQSNGSRYVKLVDFGLARKASLVDINRQSGKASMMAGTPEYLSPEQAKGLAATPRTDLYCLGVVLFEMMTGRLPFSADSVIELLHKHLTVEAPRVSTLVGGVPAPLDDLIAQLLLKPPEARPTSADAARQLVQRMLRQLREDETRIGARPQVTPGLVPAPKGMVAPYTAEETTRRAMKETGRDQAPPSSEQTAIVSDTTRFEISAVSTDVVPQQQPSSQTTRMSLAEIQRMEAVSKGANTRPDLSRAPVWVWGAVAAGVVLIAAAAWIALGGKRTAVEVIEPPPPIIAVVDPPPLPAEKPDDLQDAVPETEPPKKQPDKKPTPPPVQPPRPKPVAAKPAPAADNEDLPLVCESRDWQSMLNTQLAKYRQSVLVAVQKPGPAIDEVDALGKRLAASSGSYADCKKIVVGADKLRKKYNLPP
jgi:serine/threonine-protein kinase